jgi:hypothetical protein
MTTEPKKRRGPLLWLAGRSRWFWIGVALMPVLYVASIPPTLWYLNRYRIRPWQQTRGRIAAAYFFPWLKVRSISPQPVARWMDSYAEVFLNP